MGLFDKIFKHNQTKSGETAVKKQTEQKQTLNFPKYDFVQNYVLCNTRNMFANYHLFELCQEIPMAYEDGTDSAFRKCVMVPRILALDLVKEYENADDKTLQIEKNRTISVVKLSGTHSLYIAPNLQSPKNPIFVIDGRGAPDKEWVLHITPQKNRAITEIIKTHTR